MAEAAGRGRAGPGESLNAGLRIQVPQARVSELSSEARAATRRRIATAAVAPQRQAPAAAAAPGGTDTGPGAGRARLGRRLGDGIPAPKPACHGHGSPSELVNSSPPPGRGAGRPPGVGPGRPAREIGIPWHRPAGRVDRSCVIIQVVGRLGVGKLSWQLRLEQA
jgi:hypothetical protein